MYVYSISIEEFLVVLLDTFHITFLRDTGRNPGVWITTYFETCDFW